MPFDDDRLAAELAEQAGKLLLDLRADGGWIVDPLDGTREFGEPGRTDWAVHVALWERGALTADALNTGALTAGAVALPAQGQVLATTAPPAMPPARKAGQPLRVVVSRTRPPAFLDRLGEEMSVTLVPLGSAGAKAAAVMLGEADAYIHAGGQHEWDSAAPAAVALAAGFHASRLDGAALRYNQPDPLLPDILICPVVLAESLLEAIGAAGATRPQ